MFCTDCGQELAAEAKFCGNCGSKTFRADAADAPAAVAAPTPVRAAAAAPTASPAPAASPAAAAVPAPRKAMPAPAILGIVLVALLAVGGGGYWALVGSGQAKHESAENKIIAEPSKEAAPARPSEREEIAAANAALDQRIAAEEAEANERMRQKPLAAASPAAAAVQRAPAPAPRREPPRPSAGFNLEGERLQR